MPSGLWEVIMPHDVAGGLEDYGCNVEGEAGETLQGEE